MDLINKQVTHKSFGMGKVIEQNDSYIEIDFTSGKKSFIFPDAFGSFLKLNDKKANDIIQEMVQEKEAIQKKKEYEIEKENNIRIKERERRLQREMIIKSLKIHPSSQGVFWIEEQEIDEVFSEWKVSAGTIKSGKNAGKPNKPIRLNYNSACLLTAREIGKSEKERYIIGIYMVNEDFIGKQCEDGFIPAHSKYRIRLTQQESEKMLFWNYYINEKYPQNITWNSGKYRYFDNICIAQILKDLVTLKSGLKEQELMKEFFKYFCDMNKINEKDLPEPNGVLLRKE